MNYVGERNRELVSACNGAIWSGAWWLAARTFQLLRSHELPYWQVFLATAVLYLIGTLSYLLLIRHIERRERRMENVPPIPDPGTCVMSTLCSRAMRRTSGEDFWRRTSSGDAGSPPPFERGG